ncbi:hypothetical protein PsYK624_105910 [Phanerochaete sordida]|uniref:Telomere replication protein EST3 n=1 Tax=Phanerochaete sordida TaxID=48140 RepID=A0A9P3LHR6_9APHY|nr:hypothetical protein PsYK624_105910 [Phanerochaete sordida]
MSRSLSPPWLRDYLLAVAQTHGGDLMSVPVHTPAKKVQIVKFITRQTEGQDNWIWAVVSDLQFMLPVRFSKEAMKAFKHSEYGHSPISSYKTVAMSMKNFRPMFARVPKSTGQGMSTFEHLTLEVRTFTVIGSFDAAVWGAPKDIESEKSIQEWVHGLREGNGGGNVLKLRKQEQAEAAAATSRSSPPIYTQIVSHTPQQRNSSPDGSPRPRPPRPAQRPNKLKGGPLKAHERRWRNFKEPPNAAEIGAELMNVGHVYGSPSPGPASPPTRTDAFALPQTPPRRRTTRGALDLGSSPDRPHTPLAHRAPAAEDDARQRTPSAWSPSVHGSSPRRHIDEDEDSDADADAPGSDEDASGEEDALGDEDAPGSDDDAMPVDPASDPHEDAFGEPLSRSASPAAPPTPSPEPQRMDVPSRAQSPLDEGSAMEDGGSTMEDGHAPSSSLPAATPGRVLVPDSTQAQEGELPPSSAPSASQSEVHDAAGQADASQRDASQPDASQPDASQPDAALSAPQHEGEINPRQAAPKLVHSSQPWTSPAVTSTPLPPPPPNRAFSGTLALDAPWAVPDTGTRMDAGKGGGKGEGEGGDKGVETSQGRVLVPDSDVSGATASQSQSQSQDRVRSQVVPPDEQSGEMAQAAAQPKERAQDAGESQSRPESPVRVVPQAQDEPQDQPPPPDHASQAPEPAAQPYTQDESQGSRSGQSLSYATDSQEVPQRGAALEPAQLSVVPEEESVRADGAGEGDVAGSGGGAQLANGAADTLEPEPDAPRASDASQEADERPQTFAADAAPAQEDVSGTQDNDTADEAQAEDALARAPGSSQSDDAVDDAMDDAMDNAMDVDGGAAVPGASDVEIVQGSVMDEQVLELPEDAQDPGAPEAQDEDEDMDSDDGRTDEAVRAALLAESRAASAVQAVVREEVAGVVEAGMREKVSEVVEAGMRAAPAPQDVEEEPPSAANTSFPKRLLDTFKWMLPGVSSPAPPKDSLDSEALTEAEKMHDTAVLNAEPSGSKPAPVPEAPRTPEKTYHNAEAWKAPSFMRKQSAVAVLKSRPPRTPEPVKAKSPVSTSAPKPPPPTQGPSHLVPPPKSPIKQTPHHKALAALSISASNRTQDRTQDTSSTSRAISGTTAQSNSTLPTSVATDPASTSSMQPPRKLKRRVEALEGPPPAKRRRLAPTEVVEIPSSPEMDKSDMPPPRKKVLRKMLRAPPPGAADKGKAREVEQNTRGEARVEATAQDQDERMLEAEGEKRDPVEAGVAPAPPQKPALRVYASKRNDAQPRKEPAPIPPVKAAALNKLSAKAQGKQPQRAAPVVERAPAARTDAPAEDPRATPPPGTPAVPRSPRKSYPVQRRKAGGMTLDLSAQTLDLPPEQLVGWPRLRKMMHAHGRAQFKAKQAREGVGRTVQAGVTGKGKGKEVDRRK